MLRTLKRNTTGATSVEYALVASIISVAAIGAFLSLGEQSEAQMGSVNAAYGEANSRER